MSDFGGDVLLVDTLDGGEISIANGEIVADFGFRSAVYLSLFGGDDRDDGVVGNVNSWWGNRLSGVPENEKMISRFQAFIKGAPLTSKNINLAEDYVLQDLQWMKDEGICDEVTAEITAEEKNRINLEIKIMKDENLLARSVFGLQWEAMNGI